MNRGYTAKLIPTGPLCPHITNNGIIHLPLSPLAMHPFSTSYWAASKLNEPAFHKKVMDSFG